MLARASASTIATTRAASAGGEVFVEQRSRLPLITTRPRLQHACGLVQRRPARDAVSYPTGLAFQGIHSPTVLRSPPHHQRHSSE